MVQIITDFFVALFLFLWFKFFSGTHFSREPVKHGSHGEQKFFQTQSTKTGQHAVGVAELVKRLLSRHRRYRVQITEKYKHFQKPF